MSELPIMNPPQDKPVAYIAGPMRGYPRFNFDAFDAAKEYLEFLDYHVISPADLDRAIGFDPDDENALDEFDTVAAFDRDVAAIKECDFVALLDGHERSTGATAEKCIAFWLGKPVWELHADKTMSLVREENPVNESVDAIKSDTSSIESPSEDILDEAKRLTSGERNNSYGPPNQDFAKTATMWKAILGVDIEPKDVALCMIALKLSRATWAAKRDNWVDIAGYARCGFQCESEDECES